jgi:hypothetical protein
MRQVTAIGFCLGIGSMMGINAECSVLEMRLQVTIVYGEGRSSKE